MVDFPEGFPTGITESMLGARVEIEWRRPPGFEFRLWLGAEGIDSRRHVEGEEKVRMLSGVKLRVGWRGLRLLGQAL